jgi:hypothetical protein
LDFQAQKIQSSQNASQTRFLPSNLMSPWWLYPVCLLGAFACGPQESHNQRKTKEINPITISMNPPAERYFFDDVDCQSEPQSFIDELPVFNTTSSGVTVSFGRFRPQNLASTFATRFVRKAVFGRRFQRDCFSNFGFDRCIDSRGQEALWNLTGVTNAIRICKPRRGHFHRNSIEAATSTAAVFIESSANFLEDLHPRLENPAPVELDVFPMFQMRYKVSTSGASGDKPRVLLRYYTDNLAYTPSNATISIFPESQKLQSSPEDLRRPRLWESSFVIAHEYGHHVENILVGNAQSSLGLSWDGMHHSHAIDPTFLRNHGNAAVRYFVTAISEAFADLLAFHINGNNATSLVLIPGLGKERDPANPQFATINAQKSVDSPYIDALKRGETPMSGGVLISSHTMGAAMAHAIHLIFSELSSQQSPEASRLHSQLLMQWLERFYRIATKQLVQDSINVENLVEAFSKALSEVIILHLNAREPSYEIHDRICQVWMAKLSGVKPSEQLCKNQNSNSEESADSDY